MKKILQGKISFKHDRLNIAFTFVLGPMLVIIS